jgi:hypothetical protein
MSPSTEHIVPKNGKGGYTVLATPKGDKYKVTLCQCNPRQRYDKELGQRTAESRQMKGQFFVSTHDELVALFKQLKDKVDA